MCNTGKESCEHIKVQLLRDQINVNKRSQNPLCTSPNIQNLDKIHSILTLYEVTNKMSSDDQSDSDAGGVFS